MTGYAADEAADEAPWCLIGTPRFGGILVVADHAGWAVPGDIDLGVAPEVFGEHIAQDIGTMAVAQLLAARPGVAAFAGRYSRLVCDLNRDEDAPCIVPARSDGRDIPGNILDEAGRAARLARGRLVLVGVGGIMTGRDVLAKLRAGASLVQLYTGFALHGPALIPRLKAELLAALAEDGFATAEAAIGAGLKE